MKIADLRHRIILCSMQDVVEKDGNMSLSRKEVVRLWASIKQAKNWPSFIGNSGYSILDPKLAPVSHKITIRRMPDLEITSAAWVYEERLKSSPRWYKSLGWIEDGDWLILSVHIHEKSDNVSPPVSSTLIAQPSQVVL